MTEWTEDEEEYLKKSYPSNISLEIICDKLKRSFDSVRSKVRTLFLKRNNLKKQTHPFSIDWSNLDECTFYIEKHKSMLKDKLFTTLNGWNI